MCFFPDFIIDKILYNMVRKANGTTPVVYILQILSSIRSYTTLNGDTFANVCCVYPSNFVIDKILYNYPYKRTARNLVVYILQILSSIRSYTTVFGFCGGGSWLCISFKFCHR